jgi:hypothetical protein
MVITEPKKAGVLGSAIGLVHEASPAVSLSQSTHTAAESLDVVSGNLLGLEGIRIDTGPELGDFIQACAPDCDAPGPDL